ncbi:hypothetical protein O181_025422 [Austropuccinia psidii MF-1]|uniref:Glycoside hydrolase family 71 protein n=1 Tax=Austropuccinia psidii MF-1 TaxID=1389203 RepID=A0A9Q3CL52_9BASI|nr:hypothetical protein [Austropuccinia psidii MF-1]
MFTEKCGLMAICSLVSLFAFHYAGAQSDQIKTAAFSTSINSPRHSFKTRASTDSTTTPKLVFAHFIAGLTINYTQNDWLSHIKLAASHGIDAFALNVGAPAAWQVEQVSTAYNTASQVNTTSGSSFKLFLSLDMSVITAASDVTAWVTKFSTLPSQLLINGRPLISTFSGEANFLGGANRSAGWQAAVKTPLLSLTPPVNPLFIPVWSSLDPATSVSSNPVVDGIMTWKSWPTGSESINTVVDLQFQNAAKSQQKLYMAGVSPCFYTHYSSKNYLFRGDDNLYINRWKELIAMSPPPDFVEIISWNDYGESHYIGPVTHNTQPDDTTWVTGFEHTSWLTMTDYFIQWYKTGSQPAITEDKVYFNYRPHSRSAVASSDPLGPPANASDTNDAIYAATFLAPNSGAQQIQISVGKESQTFTNLSMNSISTFSAPWSGSGGAVQVSLLDGSGKVLMKGQAAVPIDNSIKTYNFNYATETLTKNGLQSAKSGSSDLLHVNLLYALFPIIINQLCVHGLL